MTNQPKPPPGMESLARQIIERLNKSVPDDEQTEDSRSSMLPVTDLLDHLYRTDVFGGFVYNLPRGGGPVEFDKTIKKFMPALARLLDVSVDKPESLTLVAASAFFAQLVEDDPDLYHTLVLIIEGQAEGSTEKAILVTTAMAFTLFFLNWRAGSGSLYLRGQ